MDDKIDFPASALFMNHYADQGLTHLRVSTDPRRPLGRQSRPLLAHVPDQEYWEKVIAPRLKKILGSPPQPPPPPAKKYARGDRGN